jgi:hypothetical protein
MARDGSTAVRRAQAAALYFALVFGTGFVLGTIRVPFLVPHLGERTAELLEMPIMAVAIVLAARHVVRRFDLPRAAAVRLQGGFGALVPLLGAEWALGVALQGRSLPQYIAGRDTVAGAVYLAMLLVFALMPAILTRLGGRAS